MKKAFIRLTALLLALLTITAGGAGVYADDGIMPIYELTTYARFRLTIGSGYANFFAEYEADPDIFDHAELEMRLQRKGLIFWGDVDITITEFWFYEASTSHSLRQEIPDKTGKYRALYTLRIVGNNGLTDTIEQTAEYTYN